MINYKPLKAKPAKLGITPKYAHVKRDGHRTFVTVDAFHVVRAYSSSFVDITDDLPANLLRYPARDAYVNSIIECELWVPGHPASDVKTAIVEKWHHLRLTCFAIPIASSVDLTFATLPDMEVLAAKMGFEFAEYTRVQEPVHPLEWINKANETLYAEGWVFKNYNYAEWWKLKEEKTIDAVIIGTIDGSGKNLGSIGSLVCAVYKPDGKLVTIAQAGGLSDLQRAEMDLDDPIGKVCEVSYQYIGSKGKCRHPRFKCFRPDKLPCECLIDQDTDLEEYYDEA